MVGLDSGDYGKSIIVAARPRAETVLDVPSVVNVVSADTIDKLNLRYSKMWPRLFLDWISPTPVQASGCSQRCAG